MKIRGLSRLFSFTGWRLDEVTFGIDAVQVRPARSVPQIGNAIRHGLNNGRLEGLNNLIARILHRGCGYQDADYLTLKLQQAALPRNQQVPVFQKSRRARKSHGPARSLAGPSLSVTQRFVPA
ncbi:MAG: transposase [Phycisphaerae bacterium]